MSLFTAEDIGQIPAPELTFSGNVFEDLNQTEVTSDEVLGSVEK